MSAWLANLAPRERLVLGAGAAAALVIVVLAFIWIPLARGTSARSALVEAKGELVADVQRAAALAPAADAPSPARGASRSLVVLVDETAQVGGLAESFTATRPDGRDDISVSFQNAAFDSIVRWLVELERDYGVRVESASFNEASERGLVTGQILLRRG